MNVQDRVFGIDGYRVHISRHDGVWLVSILENTGVNFNWKSGDPTCPDVGEITARFIKALEDLDEKTG